MTFEQIRDETEAIRTRLAVLEAERDALVARLRHVQTMVCPHPERVGQLCADNHRSVFCPDCGKVFWHHTTPKPQE
jgi:hypothetical protein